MTPAFLDLGVAPSLLEGVASTIGAAIVPVTRSSFPDGEEYLRVSGALGKRDVLIFAPPAGASGTVLAAFFAADLARSHGAQRVGLVAPYLGYMRQDRAFLTGEAVTSKTFARLISGAFDWLLTVDPHLHRYASLDEIYVIPSIVVSAAGPVSGWIGRHIDRPIIVGPDAESGQWVRQIADRIGAPWATFTKSRMGDREVSLRGDISYDGRTPVIIDDVISSATTMAEAVKRVRSDCAVPPVCIGVHALFAGDALRMLADAGPSAICTTDTILHETNNISVADGLAEAIDKWLER